MNYYNAIKSLHPDVEFELRDDGQGIYISKWNSELPKPELKDLEADAIYQENICIVLNKRKKEYLPISDQLDMIYHQGLDVWKSHIQAVKESNPKPIKE